MHCFAPWGRAAWTAHGRMRANARLPCSTRWPAPAMTTARGCRALPSSIRRCGSWATLPGLPSGSCCARRAAAGRARPRANRCWRAPMPGSIRTPCRTRRAGRSTCRPRPGSSIIAWPWSPGRHARRARSPSPAASCCWAGRSRAASCSTTKSRPFRARSRPSRSTPAWCRTRTISRSCTTAATGAPPAGARPDGTGWPRSGAM